MASGTGLHGIKASIDLVLCLFPFEKAFYKKWNVPAAFVGHPLSQPIAFGKPNFTSQRRTGNCRSDPKAYRLIAGSRRGEIEKARLTGFRCCKITL